MKTKITLASILVGIVIAGTAFALGISPAWQAPTKPFPDVGNIVGPLDEGSNAQSRNGVIDFSASPTSNTFSFGANQGIALPDTGTFSVTSGDFKITEFGKGVIFPDGTKQTTAAGGMFRLGKLCQAVGSGWYNTTLAPDSWAAADCNQFATKAGGTNYQLGCALSSGVSFGAVGGNFPSPNCGWSASCSSSGSYYPYNPAGCPTPQKVIAVANQVSVPDGTASVVTVPTKETVSALCAIKYPLEQCTRTSCGVPYMSYASTLACGTYLYDDGKTSSGTSCGTGTVYQVYCR